MASSMSEILSARLAASPPLLVSMSTIKFLKGRAILDKSISSR